MFSNFMNAGHDMTKVQQHTANIAKLFEIEKDGYHCYYDGGNRGNCRYNLHTPEYESWHYGYSEAEKEDSE